MRKKVIFRIAVLAAALLFSYNAHAQLILGGNIGLSVAGDNRVGINIAPEWVMPSTRISRWEV